MKHVVTQPSPPFPIAGGLLEVHQVPVWVDNLVWVLVCTRTGEAAVVDGPAAGEVLAYLDAHGFRLTTLLTTHTHPDHIGIHRELEAAGWADRLTVVASAHAAEPVPMCTQPVDEGDVVRVGAAQGRVWRTEGHQRGHVSYVFDGAVFCGDTMFAGGCGYLFDGPPEAMHASLQRLAGLPGDTRVCCAHEYTEDNLRFAWSVEPDNAELAARIRRVWALRAQGRCAVPSTIAMERATNPFLRAHVPGLAARVAVAMPERTMSNDDAVFAATRALKDTGQHKAKGDVGLPLP